MKKRLAKLNNNGSTFVMVIIAALFICVIASLVLALTINNFQSAKLRGKSTDNFYSAEDCVDEVRSTLEIYADRAAQAAYTAWLEQYSFMENAEQRKKLFYRVYEENLRKLIQEEFIDKVSAGDKSIFSDDVQGNVKWSNKDGSTDVIELTLAAPKTDLSGNPIYDGNVRLDGISLTYTDEDGLSTTITTNLDFTINYPGFRRFSASEETPAYNYVIIADGDLRNKNASDVVNVTGNIYAGGDDKSASGDKVNGIHFSGNDTKIKIRADEIITRNSIAVNDSADVTIEGKEKEFSGDFLTYMTELWAENIVLSKSTFGSSESKLSVVGRAYVSDDLSLDADNSEFTLKGEYFGYSVSNAKSSDYGNPEKKHGTPSGSSAIVINGKNAILDFSKAQTLWISGKSFVSVPSSFGSTEMSTFIEGESIAYKSLQAAYLLPGECLDGVGHNPVEADVYLKKLCDVSGKLDTKKVVLDNYRKATGIDLELYVDFTNPYRTSVVNYRQNGKDHQMIYFYLNFRNQDKAQEYFERFADVNKTLVKDRMDMFGNGAIRFIPDALVNTGNAISYNDDGVTKKITLYDGNSKYTSSEIVSKESELNTKYEAIVTTLDENNSGTTLSSMVTDSIVDFTLVDETRQVETLLELAGDSNKYYLVTGKNVVIDKDRYGGSSCAIVIATGDVEIVGGIKFNGLIIAGGDVNVTGSTMNLSSSPATVGKLIKECPEANKYFLGQGLLNNNNSGTVYTSDLITVNYDNWKKN